MSPSVVERLHVLRREDPHSASAAPPPAQRAGAVQQVDDVAAAEVEVGLLRGHVVAEGVSQAGPLQGGRDGEPGWGEREGVMQSRAEQRRAKCGSGREGCALPRPRLQTDERTSGRGCGGGPRGGTPGSSFCKGWGTGYMREGAPGGGTAEALWGGSPSPQRCCGFGSSPPADWASRRTRPRCCIARRPPAPGSAPPCRRSCNTRKRRSGTGAKRDTMKWYCSVLHVPTHGVILLIRHWRGVWHGKRVVRSIPQDAGCFSV